MKVSKFVPTLELQKGALERFGHVIGRSTSTISFSSDRGHFRNELDPACH